MLCNGNIQQLKKDIFKLNIYIDNLQHVVDKNFRKCENCKVDNILELRAELNLKRKEMSELRQQLYVLEDRK